PPAKIPLGTRRSPPPPRSPSSPRPANSRPPGSPYVAGSQKAPPLRTFLPSASADSPFSPSFAASFSNHPRKAPAASPLLLKSSAARQICPRHFLPEEHPATQSEPLTA